MKIKIIRSWFWVFLGSLLLQACAYHVEEDLYPTVECQTTEMSYSVDIVPIISNHCYSCHDMANNFANITLEGHMEILEYALDGSLLGSIKHEVSYSPMPKNQAQLIECEIEKIEAWINDGALNN